MIVPKTPTFFPLLISSEMWKKSQSEKGGNKNTKHAKFSEKRTFFTT